MTAVRASSVLALVGVMAYKQACPGGSKSNHMYKIIGGDQQEYGPVSAEEVRRWIAEGRLNGRSLVQVQGTTEWRPLATLPEFAEALGIKAAQPPGGVTAPPPVNPEIWAAEILARQPQVRVGECLSRSWNLMSANFGLFLGACAIVWAISLCQFIPVLGLVYQVLSGALYGGLYLIILKRIRGELAARGDVFAGFHVNFGQLVLAGFLSSFLSKLGLCCCLIPGVYLGVAWVFAVPVVADKGLEFWSAMELSRKVVTKVWFEVLILILAAFLPFILMSLYTGTKMSLAISPVVEQIFSGRPPDFGRMMEMFLHVNRSIFSLSFLTRVVLLFNLPFALGALMYAYENLFGPRTAATA